NLAEAREWRDKSREAGLNDPSLDYLSSASAPAKPTAGK
ncbi:MAG: sel1 repeat family protein, partial [Methylocystis sp.]|nr:sel1 repeat family protein [Methylocystis sp.]